jgi:hypothetical protein
MPPQGGSPDRSHVEVKIESYLPDPSKVFVEAIFLWPDPQPAGTTLNAGDRLMEADKYILDQVQAFILEGQNA